MALLRIVEHTRRGADEARGVFFSEAVAAASHHEGTVFIDFYDPRNNLIWAKFGMSPSEAAALGHNLIRLANEALAEADDAA